MNQKYILINHTNRKEAGDLLKFVALNGIEGSHHFSVSLNDTGNDNQFVVTFSNETTCAEFIDFTERMIDKSTEIETDVDVTGWFMPTDNSVMGLPKNTLIEILLTSTLDEEGEIDESFYTLIDPQGYSFYLANEEINKQEFERNANLIYAYKKDVEGGTIEYDTYAHPRLRPLDDSCSNIEVKVDKPKKYFQWVDNSRLGFYLKCALCIIGAIAMLFLIFASSIVFDRVLNITPICIVVGTISIIGSTWYCIKKYPKWKVKAAYDKDYPKSIGGLIATILFSILMSGMALIGLVGISLKFLLPSTEKTINVKVTNIEYDKGNRHESAHYEISVVGVDTSLEHVVNMKEVGGIEVGKIYPLVIHNCFGIEFEKGL